MKTKSYWPILILLTLASIQSVSIAEEFDEDADLEDFFSIRQKSTLSDFPLQEIAAEELSNAAIEGALQANTNIGTKAKPI